MSRPIIFLFSLLFSPSISDGSFPQTQQAIYAARFFCSTFLSSFFFSTRARTTRGSLAQNHSSLCPNVVMLSVRRKTYGSSSIGSPSFFFLPRQKEVSRTVPLPIPQKLLRCPTIRNHQGTFLPEALPCPAIRTR